MHLHTKITLGFLAMLGLLLGIGGYAYLTVGRLDRASRTILQDNFYSVQFGQGMLQALDKLALTPADGLALGQFRTLLTREAGNITEPGERRVVDSLMQAAATYPGPAPAASLVQLRQLTHRMVTLNMAAITRKNAQADHTATMATSYLLLFSVISTLVGLMLVGSVPQAAVGGLRKLTASLDHATRTNFAATVPIESTDEVGQVAAAFNRLLVHVQDFRSLSLADLTTERNRISSLVQTLDEALFMLDAKRVVLVANPGACELLGLPESQVVGRPAAELAAASPTFAAVLAPLLLPAGKRPVGPVPLTLASPTSGEPAYYQLTVHDTLAFNLARDQMEFTGSVLALRNVSVFRQLDQTKSNFLATVSHELKTPLSSINFNLKLLHDPRVGTLSAEQQAIVAAIKQENQRLLHLVGDLLTVARLEAGASIALDQRPTPVADLVAAATEPLQLQLRSRQLTLATCLPPDLPMVRADLDKTAWVLLNLLVNAVHHSPEHGHIQLSASLLPGSHAVRVQVQDHGPGIAPEYQQRIFDRFVQGPAASTGTGLGLSISREFITSQSGELGVESTLGEGSTFFFTLPVA